MPKPSAGADRPSARAAGPASETCSRQCDSDRWAIARIDEACRLAMAGKLALRDLGRWVEGLGINETEFRLLWVLFQDQRRSIGGPDRDRVLDQAELSDQLAVSPSQISGVVEQLRRRSLIDREDHPSDRRRQVWRLGPAGCALVLAVVAAVDAAADLPAATIAASTGKEAA